MASSNTFVCTDCETKSHIYTKLVKFVCASCKNNKSGLPNCVGFINCAVTATTRPNWSHMARTIAYNSHKQKYGLKFQSVTGLEGFVFNAFGPIEARRHEFMLSSRDNMEEKLPKVVDKTSVQHFIYGDWGYNRRWYLEVSYQARFLLPFKQALNKGM